MEDTVSDRSDGTEREDEGEDGISQSKEKGLGGDSGLVL